jgi:anti-sigma factor ChrR (cupin superfamily)
MKLNSPRALEIGRKLFDRHGGDWSKVRAAGQERDDGVIDLTGEPKVSSGRHAHSGREQTRDPRAARR